MASVTLSPLFFLTVGSKKKQGHEFRKVAVSRLVVAAMEASRGVGGVTVGGGEGSPGYIQAGRV